MAGIKNRKIYTYEESHREVNGIIQKKCNLCEEWFDLSLDNFYKNDCSPDGFFPSCKPCYREKKKKYRTERNDYYSEYHKNWYRAENNKERIKEYNKNYKSENRELMTEKEREWKRKYPEKCKGYNEGRQHKNHKISNEQWEACKKYFIHRCAYCGLALEEHYIQRNGELQLGDFHKEHVDDNGLGDLSNCVPSCKECNSQKWKFTLNEWYTDNNTKFSQERLDRINKWLNEDYKSFIED